MTAGKGLKKCALCENATPMQKTKGLELHVVPRHAHDACEAVVQPILALTYYTTVRWVLGIVNTKSRAGSRLLRRVACVFSSRVWVYNRSKRRSYTSDGMPLQGHNMDGFWTAEFGTNSGMFGGGVAFLQDGKLKGGDSFYYYVGEYNLSGKTFTATLRISPFIVGARSVFGTVNQELTLELVGSLIDDGKVIAQGRAREMPNQNFAVKLTKRD